MLSMSQDRKLNLAEFVLKTVGGKVTGSTRLIILKNDPWLVLGAAAASAAWDI